jgi:hypothetical protein
MSSPPCCCLRPGWLVPRALAACSAPGVDGVGPRGHRIPLGRELLVEATLVVHGAPRGGSGARGDLAAGLGLLQRQDKGADPARGRGRGGECVCVCVGRGVRGAARRTLAAKHAAGVWVHLQGADASNANWMPSRWGQSSRGSSFRVWRLRLTCVATLRKTQLAVAHAASTHFTATPLPLLLPLAGLLSPCHACPPRLLWRAGAAGRAARRCTAAASMLHARGVPAGQGTWFLMVCVWRYSCVATGRGGGCPYCPGYCVGWGLCCCCCCCCCWGGGISWGGTACAQREPFHTRQEGRQAACWPAPTGNVMAASVCGAPPQDSHTRCRWLRRRGAWAGWASWAPAALQAQARQRTHVRRRGAKGIGPRLLRCGGWVAAIELPIGHARGGVGLRGRGAGGVMLLGTADWGACMPRGAGDR